MRLNDVRLQVIETTGQSVHRILCTEVERNSIRGRRIFIGFPDKFAKPAFYAGLVSLGFTGDNRRGAPNVQISAVIATQLRKACISQVSSKRPPSGIDRFQEFEHGALVELVKAAVRGSVKAPDGECGHGQL